MKSSWMLIVLLVAVWVEVNSQHPPNYSNVDHFLNLEDGYSANFHLNQISISSHETALRKIEADYYLSKPVDSLVHRLTQIKKQGDQYSQFLFFLLLQNQRLTPDQVKDLRHISYQNTRFSNRLKIVLGRVYLDQNQIDSAQAVLNYALFNLQKDSIHNYIQMARVRNLLGRSERRGSNWQNSISQFKLALALYENSEVPKWSDAGRVLNNMAISYQDMNKYEDAKATFQKSIALKEKHDPDSTNLAIAYNNLGNLFLRYNNNLEAEKSYKKGFAFSSTAKSYSPVFPELYNNYGSLLSNQMREYTSANIFFDKSLATYTIREGSYSHRLVDPILNKINVLINLHKYAGIDGLFAKVDSIQKLHSLPETQKLRIQITKASYFTAQGFHTQASKRFESGDSILSKAGHIPDQMVIDFYSTRSQNLSHLAQYDSAIKLVKFILTEFATVMGLPDRIALLNMCGEYYDQQEEIDSARSYINKSLQLNILQQPVAGNNFLTPHEALVSYYRTLKLLQKEKVADDQQLLFFIDAGLSIIQSQHATLTSDGDRINNQSIALDFFDLAIQLSITRFQLSGNNKLFEKCFELMQQSKYKMLYSTIETDRLQSFADVPNQIRQKEDDLLRQQNQLAFQVTSFLAKGESANKALLDEFTSRHEKASSDYSRLIDSLKVNLPNYYNLKYSIRTIGISQIESEILNPKKIGLLEFHLMDNMCAAILITHQHKYAWLFDSKTLAKDIKLFRNEIATHSTSIQISAYHLYLQLFKNIDDMFTHEKNQLTRLIIIPDKDLVYLPFEALASDTLQEDNYLVNRYSISYALSSPLLWQTYTDAVLSKGEREFLGVAPSFEINSSSADRSDENRYHFSPLANTQKELDAISQILGKRNYSVKMLKGTQATKQEFLGQTYSYNFIHIATHGFVNMTDPLKSGIAFTLDPTLPGSEVLLGSEVFNLKLRAHLVTLSACETGLGKMYRGEGLIGLSRGFFYAGAQNMLISLWKVADDSTADLMVEFYKKLKNPHELSFALREAKLKLAHSKKYNHPYYWAPFILIGT